MSPASAPKWARSSTASSPSRDDDAVTAERATLRREVRVKASAAEVWAVVGDPARIVRARLVTLTTGTYGMSLGHLLVSDDLTVDGVWFIQAKYDSTCVLNTSPAAMFDHLLADEPAVSRASWFAVVAPHLECAGRYQNHFWAIGTVFDDFCICSYG